MFHDLAGGEMVRVLGRILLLMTVLAVGRVVIDRFLQVDESNAVIVVVVRGGECTSETSPIADSRED